MLYIHHDEGATVYINGVKAAVVNNATSGYAVFPITKESKEALRLNGKNVVAISCGQTGGG